MRLHSQTNTTRILPGRLCPLFTLSAHSWISQAKEAEIFFRNNFFEILISLKHFSVLYTYFREVVFLSVVVSVMCRIFSRWLKWNVLQMKGNLDWLQWILKPKQIFSGNNLKFYPNPNPALARRCFETDQKIFLK